jgi:hypothetical protein
MPNKFELGAVKFKPAVTKSYDMIAIGLPRPTNGGFALTLLARRRSGKTNLVCKMILDGGYHKAFDNIIVMSPTVFLDATYTSLKKLDNVWVTDQINNETFMNILMRQKDNFLKDPKHSATLLVLDDAGNHLRAKEARKLVDIFYSTARQYNLSIICNVQSVSMLTSLQLTNTQFWCIWSQDGRATKKLSNELACHLTPKQFEETLKKATSEPYSFLYIDTQAANDADTFKKNFTEEIV